MFQLSLMLERADVRVVDEWEDYMNDRSSQQRVWHARDDPERPDYEPAFFSKPAAPGWAIPGNMLRAVAVHLQTPEYNDEDMRFRREQRPDPQRLGSIQFVAWDAYTSSSDEGVQRYRCERRTMSGQAQRDASWATVSIMLWRCVTASTDYAIKSTRKRLMFTVVCAIGTPGLRRFINGGG